MENTIKVAIGDKFFDSFAALPRQIQVKVTEFINKFRNNPRSSSINLEKVQNAQDDKIYSARINDTYRTIIAVEENTGVYLILWIDHHDEAYNWAKRKKCKINKELGSIEVFDVVSNEEENNEHDNSNTLFKEYNEQELIDIGVPKEQILFVKDIQDIDKFNKMKDSFTKETYESLEWLANGFEYKEVKELYDSQKLIDEPIPNNFAEALNSTTTKHSFVIVEGEEELEQIMSEPLEKWRIFLHPSQRKLVERNFNGPARVTGGAGTGKTVVAMHRAKELVRKLDKDKKILFTTFTANLANDIQYNLKKICNGQDIRNIEVINLDAWVSEFLKLNGYNYRIDYEKIDEIWSQAYINSGENIDYDWNFVKDEYIKIIVCQEELSLQAYMNASRVGRGIKIDRQTKIKIWNIVEEYLKILRDEQVRDIDTAMFECRTVLKNYQKKLSYQYIIIDEGQDFSTNAYKLLRLIAGEEHRNDMFIVGESHQRIYNKKAILSKCGINVRGRGSILKINYRTTEEIRKYAIALLKGISFDNLDNEEENQDQCQSLTHGDKPIIKNFRDGNEEFDYLFTEINKLKDDGVDLRNICIVTRTRKYVDSYNSMFTSKGIRVYEIRGNKVDDRNYDGLRIATMHRVKGLEFQYVFVVACNDRVIPLQTAINIADPISKQESMISERCLLYVALTRAQKKAYITSYGNESIFLK